VDRRDHRRVPIETDVTIRGPGQGAGASTEPTGLSEQAEFSVEGRGGDISVGGIYLVAEERLPAGSTVDVAFDLPEVGEAFDLVAEVRWTRRMPQSGGEYLWAVGLEFDDIDRSRKAILDGYVLDQLSE
jgi:c-di-GMP-binding flagellar brake protein YcgR